MTARSVNHKGYSIYSWRNWVLCITFTITLLMTIARRDLNVCLTLFLKDKSIHMGMTRYGIINSLCSATYSISKIIGGVAADYIISPRTMLLIAIGSTGIANVLFGFSSSFVEFALCWGLNGLALGISWIPCAKMLNAWITEQERATRFAVVASAQTVGGALVATLGGYVADHYGWRATMTSSGVGVLAIGALCFLFILESPEQAGFTEADLIDRALQKHIAATTKTTIDDVNTVKLVLTSLACWLLSIATMCLYIVRNAVLDWIILLLVEQRLLSPLLANSCIFWFEVAGFFGGFAASVASDRYWLGKRVPVIIISSFGIILCVFWMSIHVTKSYFVNCFILTLTGFCIYAPQTLLSVAAMEVTDKRATGTILGMIGVFAGIGSILSGAPLGYVIKHFGWNTFMGTLSLTSVIMTLSLLPLYVGETRPTSTRHDL